MFLIFALKDEKNLGAEAGRNLFPLAMFFVVFGIGACFGWETGYAINLARDFGPRLVSFWIGYGGEVWRAGDGYFWVGIFEISLSLFLFCPRFLSLCIRLFSIVMWCDGD